MSSPVRTKVISVGIVLGLLVVAGVIIMPQFETRVDRVRPVSCENNERQIALALLQYVQDYDEKFPVGINSSGIGWAGTIQNYVKSTSAFHCPQDVTAASALQIANSYGLNANIVGKKANGALASIGAPAKTVLIFEVSGDPAQLHLPDEAKSTGAKSFSAVGDGIDGGLLAGDAPNLRYATGILGMRPIRHLASQFPSPFGRHEDGANFMLGDGHVKWLLPSHVSNGADALQPRDGQSGRQTGRAAGTENRTFEATFSTK